MSWAVVLLAVASGAISATCDGTPSPTCKLECKNFCCNSLNGFDRRADCAGCPTEEDCILLGTVNEFKCNPKAFDYTDYGFGLSCQVSSHHSIEVNVQRGINEALVAAMNIGRFLVGNGTDEGLIQTCIETAMVREVDIIVLSLQRALANQTYLDEQLSDLLSAVSTKFTNTSSRVAQIKAYSYRLKEWMEEEVIGIDATQAYEGTFYGLKWDFNFKVPDFLTDPSSLASASDASLGSLASMRTTSVTYACKQADILHLFTDHEESLERLTAAFNLQAVVAPAHSVGDARSCSRFCESTKGCDFFAFGHVGEADVCAMMASIPGECELDSPSPARGAIPPTFATVPGWVSGSAGAFVE